MSRLTADISTESRYGSETGADDVSVWSGETDEGLEASDSLMQGAELQNEEYLMNISARLQAAVEKLLVAITETTNQVWLAVLAVGLGSRCWGALQSDALLPSYTYL